MAGAQANRARIMPARFVKPFLDAEAIAEAVGRPTMRFIQVRQPEQIDLQALHRVRERIVANRTALSNQIRARSASNTELRCAGVPAS
jgi:transposase